MIIMVNAYGDDYDGHDCNDDNSWDYCEQNHGDNVGDDDRKVTFRRVSQSRHHSSLFGHIGHGDADNHHGDDGEDNVQN